MITSIKVINRSIISHSYFFVARTLKIYPPSAFQVYNTILFPVVTICASDLRGLFILPS